MEKYSKIKWQTLKNEQKGFCGKSEHGQLVWLMKLITYGKKDRDNKYHC